MFNKTLNIFQLRCIGRISLIRRRQDGTFGHICSLAGPTLLGILIPTFAAELTLKVEVKYNEGTLGEGKVSLHCSPKFNLLLSTQTDNHTEK